MTGSSWFGGTPSSGISGFGAESQDFHQSLPSSTMNHHRLSNTKPISIKEAVQVLYPQKRSIVVSGSGGGNSRAARSRFSTLLLEHGEKHVQDWAVMAYSNPTAHQHLSSSQYATPRSKSKQSQGTTWAAQPSPATTATPKKSKRQTTHKVAAASSSTQNITKESHPTAHMTKWEGRLHLCSQSLVFEPTDFSRGIVRIPFGRMPDGPPTEYPNQVELSKMTVTGQSFSDVTMGVECTSTRHWVMRENGSIGPYQSVAVTCQFKFTFLHSSPSTLVELCQKLFALQNSKSPQALEELLQPMYDRPFDFQANLQDVRERPVTSSNNLAFSTSLHTTHQVTATSAAAASAGLKCQWMQPLQSQPGCLVVTQERLYFQPSSGVLGAEFATSQSHSWLLHSQLVATARRYKGLEDSALELYWKDGTSTLFGFERKHDREHVLRLLPPHVPCHTDREFLVQTFQAWQNKQLTNLEYLLLLNSAAGRSFQDLSRYPVVPWVIQDYESQKLDLNNPATFRDLTRPIGALNPDRLEYFRQRFEGMQDAVDFPFLYGTHYSAAGYVLYYLVRSMPEHMLCLQNGKFDAPDRMFHSVKHTYSTLLTNHADLKELIPEFYNPNLDYDFLINARGLQLGATQMGDRVNDVTLPPWAKSPRDFIKKNAHALESDICTKSLPRWIDLIFGCKSRGEAAKEASNLFHRYAYMGPADIANMPTHEERYQAELHATEFGLVPDQLFVGPHPLKHETVDDAFVSTDIGRTFSGTDELLGKGEAWELLEPPSNNSSHGDTKTGETTSGDLGDDSVLATAPSLESTTSDDPTSAPAAPNLTNLNSAAMASTEEFFRDDARPKDRSLPLSGNGDGKASGPGAFSFWGKEPTLSNISSSSGLGGGMASPKSVEASQLISSEWDIKFFEKRKLHEDAVSGCELLHHSGPDGSSLLVSTSLDGGLKVHSVSLSKTAGSMEGGGDDKNQYSGITSTLSRFGYITMSRGGQGANTENQSKLTEYRSHTSRDPLACLAVAGDGHGGKVAFAGGHDDVVLAYGINSGCAVASVYSHRDAVTGLTLLVRPKSIGKTSLWMENATHIMVSGSWDATVKVWSVTVANGETVSIDREALAELFDADSSIVSVSAAPVPQTGGIVIGAGCADGSFCIWNLHSDGVKVLIHKEAARRGSGPCSVVQWSTSATGKLNIFTGFATGKVASYTLMDGGIKKASAASVGVAVQSLVYSEGILLIGCADGGLRLIPIRDGAYFTPDLSLWPAVNSKSSPGLTSVGISFRGNAHDGSGRCICCTGAEDGSIAIFELKRVGKR